MKRRFLALLGILSLVALLFGAPAPAGQAVAQSAQVAETSSWCAAVAAGAPVVDVLGDSVSAGSAVSTPSYRWHALLGDSLRSDGAPGTQVWTGGAIDGSATADYQPGARYYAHIEFTIHQPDLVIMGWGINDWAGYVPVETFRTQYQHIIDDVHQISPHSTILLVHTPWVYNASITSARGSQAPYRDVIRDLAHLNGAYYLGLEWYFPGDNRNATSTPDLVHLNANGQATQYAAVQAYLRGLCGGR